MFWLDGRGTKRGRPDAICHECEEEAIYFSDDDDWATCGQCERVMCSDCMNHQCDYCKDHDDKDLVTVGSSMCERCSTACDECFKAAQEEGTTDFYFCHSSCLAEHHKECSAKSRSQRALAFLDETIKNKKIDLHESKQRLESLKRHIASLETGIARSEQERAKIEKQETGSDIKPEAAKGDYADV